MVGACTANTSASSADDTPVAAARRRAGLSSPWRHIRSLMSTAGIIATANASVGSIVDHSAVV